MTLWAPGTPRLLTICPCAFSWLSVDVFSLFSSDGLWIYTLLPLYLYYIFTCVFMHTTTYTRPRTCKF